MGFLLTFMPMYGLGLLGMPRRLYTYAPNLGWSTLDLISAIGAYIIGAAVIIFVVNIVRSLLVGEPAGDDPWDAWTLEWATSSPPPHGNFAPLPWVRSERPLWDAKHARQAARATPTPAAASATRSRPRWPPFTPRRPDRRPLDAPFRVTALASSSSASACSRRCWSRASASPCCSSSPACGCRRAGPCPNRRSCPRQRFTALGAGTLLLIGSEIVLFGALVAADLHLRIHDSAGHAGQRRRGCRHAAHRQHRHPHDERHRGPLRPDELPQRRKTAWFRFYLVLTMILGAVFLGGQAWEYTHAGFGLSSGLTGRRSSPLTGPHGAHVTAGILLLVYLLFRAAHDRRGRPAEPTGAAAAIARAPAPPAWSRRPSTTGTSSTPSGS